VQVQVELEVEQSLSRDRVNYFLKLKFLISQSGEDEVHQLFAVAHCLTKAQDTLSIDSYPF